MSRDEIRRDRRGSAHREPRTRRLGRRRPLTWLGAVGLVLATFSGTGCMVGPDYVR
ncbi:MAG: hypothetical protein ACYS15_03735 [Planctomycetota bacterium]|jgi:hypothetical protein